MPHNKRWAIHPLSWLQGELDAAEHKRRFDAQLQKANTDAAEFKATHDKVRRQGKPNCLPPDCGVHG